MSITSPPVTTPHLPASQRAELPRYVRLSAWAVAIMVAGQFAMLAVVPVTLVLVGVLRHSRRSSLRWSAAALTVAYGAPLAIWALRDDPARSLSRDMHPALAVLVVAASAVVLGVIHAHGRARS